MSAIISECGTYRYRLERVLSGPKWEPWNDDTFAYFGINPSTADAEIDDQTVKKWMGFTCINGGGKFIVGNVFAFRSTEVVNLAKAADPVGPDNVEHIREIARDADILIPCWGSRDKIPKHLRHHIDATMKILISTGKPILTLGFTESGDPNHPMMLSYQTNLVQLPQ